MLRPFRRFVHPAINPATGRKLAVSQIRTRSVSNSDTQPKSKLKNTVNNTGFTWHYMCFLSFVMVNKTSMLITAVLNLLLLGVMAKLWQRFNKRAPVGYQDESGFHYGVRKG